MKFYTGVERYKLFRRSHPLVIILLSTLIGILSVHLSWWWGCIAFLLLLSLLGLSVRKFIIGTVLVLGISCFHFKKLERQLASIDCSQKYKVVTLTGDVMEEAGNKEVIIEVDDSKYLKKGTLCMLKSERALRKGDHFTGEFSFFSIKKSRNWASFKKQKWLSRKGVSTILIGAAEVDGQHWWQSVDGYIERARGVIRARLVRGVKDEQAKVMILSMFMGEKLAYESKVKKGFQFAGVMHVFSVSGMHVVLVCSVFSFLLKIPIFPKKYSAVILITVAVFYTGLTGWGIPALRATLMYSVYILAPVVFRKSSILNSLAASALILLLVDSYQVFDVGFHLSFGVVLAIVLLQPLFSRVLSWIRLRDPFFPVMLRSASQRWLDQNVEKFRVALVVTFSAWLGAGPLSLLYFKIISPVALLIAIPVGFFLYVTIVLCLISLVVGSASNWLGSQVNRLNEQCALWSYAMVSSASKLPYSYIQRSETPSESIEVFDMRSGGAVYVNLGEGSLIDCGAEKYNWELKQGLSLFPRGVKNVFLSHTDSKHYGGIKKLSEYYDGLRIYPAELITSSGKFNQFLTYAAEQGAELNQAEIGKSEDQVIEIIYNGATSASAYSDDRACVYKINFDGIKIIILNDIGFYAERALLESCRDEILGADVLVMGAPSAQAPVSSEFLQQICPKLILLCHGHSYYEGYTFEWLNELDTKQLTYRSLKKLGGVSLTLVDGKLEIYSVLKSKKITIFNEK